MNEWVADEWMNKRMEGWMDGTLEDKRRRKVLGGRIDGGVISFFYGPS